MTLDIWQLLKGDERIIVKSHLHEGLIVTWDAPRMMLELWHLNAERSSDNKSVKVGWKFVTARPLACKNLESFAKARAAAEMWLAEFVAPKH
jgi:hypothetical protein